MKENNKKEFVYDAYGKYLDKVDKIINAAIDKERLDWRERLKERFNWDVFGYNNRAYENIITFIEETIKSEYKKGYEQCKKDML